LALLVYLSLLACGDRSASVTGAEKPAKPNADSATQAAAGLVDDRLSVLLITLDTTRADALSCYGVTQGVTPELDRLASEGVLYMQARTVAPLTLPAHASMLTGLYPIRHTVRDNSLSALPDSAATIAELAGPSGYQTAAFVSSVVLTRSFGLAQGFEVYDEPRREIGKTDSQFEERPADQMAAVAKDWLRKRDRTKPFFLWVHFFDPHNPYNPPPWFLDQGRGNPYLAEVAAVDHAIGQLRATFSQAELDQIVIMVVADHGEGMGEHGEVTHGAYCYDSTLRVPLLVRYPDLHRAGEQSNETVSVVDVFPTLAEAMGLEASADVDGVSLYRRRVAAERGVYFESYYGYLNHGWSPLSGWVAGGTKYLHSSQPEIYDLARDANEENAQSSKRSQVAARGLEAISQIASLPRLESLEQQDQAVLEQLQGLGYLTSGSSDELPHPLAKTGLPSPGQSGTELEKYLYAIHLRDSGDVARGVRLLEEVVSDNPRNTAALDSLAAFLLQMERYEEALQRLNSLLELGGERAITYLNLGFCLQQLGDLEAARAHYLRCLELDPGNVKAMDNLVQVLEQLGLSEEAKEMRDKLSALVSN
jgi:arylsulfatase A-like enzyme/Tfp pilus assembly protein PilF